MKNYTKTEPIIHIHDWEDWQSFRKDRGAPPWIKVYRNLLSNQKWAVLSDAEKGQLVSIWIVAADRNGEIPNDPAITKKICQLDEEPNFSKFISLGLLTPTGCHGDTKLSLSTRQDGEPEESRGEKRRSDKRRVEKNYGANAASCYAPAFEHIWLLYPKRAGSNPKLDASKAYSATIKRGADPVDVEAGLRRYIRFCEATGKIETECVMQTRTFLGSSKRWAESWDLPKCGAALSHANNDAIARALGETV